MITDHRGLTIQDDPASHLRMCQRGFNVENGQNSILPIMLNFCWILRTFPVEFEYFLEFHALYLERIYLKDNINICINCPRNIQSFFLHL